MESGSAKRSPRVSSTTRSLIRVDHQGRVEDQVGDVQQGALRTSHSGLRLYAAASCLDACHLVNSLLLAHNLRPFSLNLRLLGRILAWKDRVMHALPVKPPSTPSGPKTT